jgi:hypothetical protein
MPARARVTIEWPGAATSCEAAGAVVGGADVDSPGAVVVVDEELSDSLGVAADGEGDAAAAS